MWSLNKLLLFNNLPSEVHIKYYTLSHKGELMISTIGAGLKHCHFAWNGKNNALSRSR